MCCFSHILSLHVDLILILYCFLSHWFNFLLICQCFIILIIVVLTIGQGMMAHTYNICSWEAEAGSSWLHQQSRIHNSGQPALYRESLSQNKPEQNKTYLTSGVCFPLFSYCFRYLFFNMKFKILLSSYKSYSV